MKPQREVDALVVSGPTELAFDLNEHPVYQAAVGASFVSASSGFTGLAVTAWRRRLRARR